uniref:Uncharacterized protein n=1 Tax=Anguilla anguilla TaxID=7936 RepID=A0A0E9VKE2_ANGAN
MNLSQSLFAVCDWLIFTCGFICV